MSAETRLAELEAEAVLLKQRIREAADAGNLPEVERLYCSIPELRLRLLAARYTVARITRRITKQYGFNSALTEAEHHLAVELATLGTPIPPEFRSVLG